MEGNSEVINLVLIGKTGNGKSATGNSILGRKAFCYGSGPTAVTKKCQLEHVTTKDGRRLNVIDTPGFFNPNVKMDIIGQEIIKCIELAKEGLHGVLFVLSVRDCFSEEEAYALKALQRLFGENIMNYVVVIFTRGDELEANEETFEDYLRRHKQIMKLLLKCNQRKVIFDNRTTSGTVKEKQVIELLNQIESIMLQNESRPFHQFQEMETMRKYLNSSWQMNGMHEHSLREVYKKESVSLMNGMHEHSLREV